VEALTESTALMRQQGNLQGVASNLLNFGMVYTRQRRFADAEVAFAEAAAVYQASGYQGGLAETYLHAAHLARDQEQLERAEQLYAESLQIHLGLGNRPRLAPALEGTAHVLLRRYVGGTHERSLLEVSTLLFACGAALRESTGVPLPTVSQRVYQPDLQQLQALLGPALFEATWVVGWEMPVLTLIDRLPALPKT